MITTRACEVLGIEHPILLGGMGTGTNPALVAAVSNAGGLGILGASSKSNDEIHRLISEIRALTDRPFGVNLLLAFLRPGAMEAVLEERVPVLSLAWGDPTPYVQRAKDAGCRVVHMAPDVQQAVVAASCGADIIVAQGTEGGGHVGQIATLPLVPQVVDAVAPVPVIAAGGIADGRGLVAALGLGAEGVLMGTRFLATTEAPISDIWKRAIVEARAGDTVFTKIPDLAQESKWPGAWSRVIMNDFVRTWLGREDELRDLGLQVGRLVTAAAAAQDREGMALYSGEGCGLITSVEPAGDVVRRVIAEAEAILRGRFQTLVSTPAATHSTGGAAP